MRYLVPLLVLAPALILPGCDLMAPAPEEPAVDLCHAATFQPYVGQPVSVLLDFVVPEPFRVIRPGDAVTEDYSAQRLNIRLDGADRINAVDCG
jgi:hypothetical protein